jgi:hypothetical protein
MGGQPVWLASVSLSRGGPSLATDQLADRERQLVRELLLEALDGVGNLARQRLFRMQLTTCLHRALTDDEVRALPASFHDAPPIDLAGGPVEILWETESDRPSTKPCERVRRRIVYPTRPDLWFPEDCGACDPCRARAELGSYVGLDRALAEEGITPS